jgi:hypothetical protein
MKKAIFCLTRGYPHGMMYGFLVRRNLSISQYLKNENADILLFHEGNIPVEHQQFIQKQTPDLPLKWIRVPWNFPWDMGDIPEQVMDTFRSGGCYPGYHLMCHFHSCEVWDYLKEYDVVLRVDEDCILTSPKWENVFQELGDVDYRTCRYETEIHVLTKEKLPEWLGEDSKYYDNQFPYTNVFITKMKPWLREDVQAWIKKLRDSKNCLRYRWGDLPIHGVMLKKFAISNSLLEGYSYYHGSHKTEII